MAQAMFANVICPAVASWRFITPVGGTKRKYLSYNGRIRAVRRCTTKCFCNVCPIRVPIGARKRGSRGGLGNVSNRSTGTLQGIPPGRRTEVVRAASVCRVLRLFGEYYFTNVVNQAPGANPLGAVAVAGITWRWGNCFCPESGLDAIQGES